MDGSAGSQEHATQQSDEEKATQTTPPSGHGESGSAIKALGWLDRLLAIWVFLAMVIGILLGNYVPETADVLHRGEFVGASVPIGELKLLLVYLGL